jgi:hypothetical protein
MSSTIEYSVKTTKVCDRCGITIVVDKLNPKADEGWMALHSPEIVPTENFDLCPTCAQDFRQKFMAEKG